MEKIVELNKVTKTFGSFVAVNQLDLEIFRGDVFGFLGPNGAGKSTTIRMLLSLIKPSTGNIKIFNKDLNNHRNYILQRIGSIVEKPDFYKNLSGAKNLEIFSILSGVKTTAKKVDEVLELVGLRGRGRDVVKTYSHGMKQRLGLAQALIHEPELIILDEPTTGLDPQGIIDIRNLILHLNTQKGITVFLSSHILSEIELIATRMAILSKGKTVVQGSVEELLNNDNVIVTLRCDPMDKAVTLLKEKNIQIDNRNTHQLTFHSSASALSALNKMLVSADVNVYELSSKRKLEDYFLKLTSVN